MPKTRKKRKKKKTIGTNANLRDPNVDFDAGEVQISTQASEQAGAKVGSSSVSEDKSEEITIGPSEEELKTELEIELKRLQDEYKRQKHLTTELERKNVDLDLDLDMDPDKSQQISIPSPIVTKPVNFEPEQIITQELQQESADIYLEPKINIDEAFLSESNAEKELFSAVGELRTELGELKVKVESKLDREMLDRFEPNQDIITKLSTDINKFQPKLQLLQKDIEKNDQKLSNILLDLGFEESLDINKIPNYILVLVYETIINDIISRIQHVLGGQDTETAVNKILENVRSHTSGGELFKFEHNRIKIPDLRQYLDRKMISPKQIHLTFTAIINQMIEYVPGYTPKNFKAMIKLMSQEFAVDTSSKLNDKFEQLTTDLTEFRDNFNKFMANYQDQISNLKKESYEEDMVDVNNKISELSSKIDELPATIDKRLEEELGNKLDEKISKLSAESSENFDLKDTGSGSSNKEPDGCNDLNGEAEGSEPAEDSPETKETDEPEPLHGSENGNINGNITGNGDGSGFGLELGLEAESTSDMDSKMDVISPSESGEEMTDSDSNSNDEGSTLDETDQELVKSNNIEEIQSIFTGTKDKVITKSITLGDDDSIEPITLEEEPQPGQPIEPQSQQPEGEGSEPESSEPEAQSALKGGFGGVAMGINAELAVDSEDDADTDTDNEDDDGKKDGMLAQPRVDEDTQMDVSGVVQMAKPVEIEPGKDDDKDDNDVKNEDDE